MTDAELRAEANRLAERFRYKEDIELAIYPDGQMRDLTLVEWVIRRLGDRNNEYGPLLDAVWERRNRTGATS